MDRRTGAVDARAGEFSAPGAGGILEEVDAVHAADASVRSKA
ncbi:MAG: hypothetical protein ACT4QF_01910 [Sporichthyaceae bacterium]|jgi:hypothetical protein